MSYIGDQSTATCDMARNTDRAFAMRKATLSETGTFSSMSIYVSGASGSQVYKLCIWDATGTDSGPGALKGTSNEGTVTSSSAAWRTLDFATPFELTAGDYWLGAITGTTAYIIYTFRTAGGAHDSMYITNTYTSGAPNPYGSGTWEAYTYGGIYATYTAASADPPFTGLRVTRLLQG